jgi:arsenite methyltransferase
MYDVVKDYYGKELQSTSDLKTSACCDASAVPAWLKPVLSNIHEEVLSRYYGCGLVCPPLLEGCRVLDLGCGTGRDVYALAQLVGKTGSVVGVDMTDEQLDVAAKYQQYHADEFGFDNVTFIKGYIEKLSELGLEPNSFDVIVSNCVINLSPDKDAVLRGVKSLLKPGGEFYFSDIYANRRLPDHLREHPVLYGECLGGALYWNDFLRLSRRTGFIDPRLVEDRQLDITDAALAKIVGETKFFSATYRLINIGSLEDACEDHGQAVIYKGTIKDHPDSFDLDGHHHIETGRIFPVCGNTYKMLNETRMRDHFEFIGDFDRHFGIFDGCGTSLPFAENATSVQTAGGACC